MIKRQFSKKSSFYLSFIEEKLEMANTHNQTKLDVKIFKIILEKVVVKSTHEKKNIIYILSLKFLSQNVPRKYNLRIML